MLDDEPQPQSRLYYGHVVPVHGPVDPGFGVGRPPVDPEWGVDPPLRPGPPKPPEPVDPGWGIPVLPIPPEFPPAVGSGKPAGIPILPMEPHWTAPTAPPLPPGTWVTVQAGRGQPPAWAFIAKDTGLAPEPKGGAQPGQKGHYVPVGLAQPKDAPGDPTWAWIPEIGPDYGVKPPAAQPKR
jgi:hypothetical protein